VFYTDTHPRRFVLCGAELNDDDQQNDYALFTTLGGGRVGGSLPAPFLFPGIEPQGNRLTMHGTSKNHSVKVGYEACRSVSENPPTAQYLRGRALSEATADQVGVRYLSGEADVWFHEYFSQGKIEVGDLITPVFDIDGEMQGVRGWPVPVYEGRDLTRLAMKGEGESKGLVMAAGLGLAWLRGEIDPVEFWLVEGEPDLLTAYQVWAADEARKDVAIIGVVAGSWTRAHGEKIKAGSRVLILTHDDELAAGQKYPQGEQYARHVFFSLPEGCEVLRYADPEGEHRDLNNLLKAGELDGRELADFCAPYSPEPDPTPPPAPPKETGSERGGNGTEDESGWIIARAALAWVTTWQKCLDMAGQPGGTHGKGGWSGLAWTCFRAAHGLQDRKHRVSAAQMDGVEGAAFAFALLDPTSMEAELLKAAAAGAQGDEATRKNREKKAESCAKDGAKEPLDMDGLTKYMDTRPPELKPKKEKEPKAKEPKAAKPTKTPPPALRIVRLDEIAPPVAAEARDYGEEEDEAEEDRRGFPPLPQVRDESWKDELTRTRDGETKGTIRNIDLILSNDPRCAGGIKLNDLLGRLEIYRSPEWAEMADGLGGVEVPAGTALEDEHLTALQGWLAKEYWMSAEKHAVLDVLRMVGRRHKYNPLVNYLNGLVWDKKPRLDSWLETYCAVKMELDVAAFTGRKWMISAVARALDPGCQADHSLILEGEQGSGKSQALFALCPNPEWHMVFDSDPGTKDALENMQGKWLIELAELAILSRGRDARIIKGFLTKMIDRYRASYGTLSKDRRRCGIFFGTVNPEGAGDYLTDPTGNRRWWPARCSGLVDLAGIRRDRDQLWAEAVWRFKQGEIYHPTPEESVKLEAARDLRTARHPWTYPITVWANETTLDTAPINQVIELAVHLEVGRQTKADQMAAAVILKAAGWTNQMQTKLRVHVWCKPGYNLAEEEAKEEERIRNGGVPKTPEAKQGTLGSGYAQPHKKAQPPAPKPQPAPDADDPCPF